MSVQSWKILANREMIVASISKENPVRAMFLKSKFESHTDPRREVVRHWSRCRDQQSSTQPPEKGDRGGRRDKIVSLRTFGKPHFIW